MAHTRRKNWTYLLLAAISIALPTTAVALDYGSSNLSIQVLDKGSGKAVGNAAVCLGTSANSKQFGVERTGADGMARFGELLPDSLLVTVSKPGFKGSEQVLEPVSTNRVFMLKITSGGGGPVCSAPPVRANQSESGGLNIRHIAVDKTISTGAAGQVLVSVTVQGTANQVRISEVADFSGADWRALQFPIPYQLSEGGGPKDIYVQVRRYAHMEGANIEVASPVRRVKYYP